MNVLKYNPFNLKHYPVNSISDHLFNRSIADFVGSDFINNRPSVNVIETDKKFKIELAAPGLKKEDFQINIEKDQLKISVEKKTEQLAEGEKFTRREFNYSAFEKQFKLSNKVDSQGISAAYKNGVLNITLPKKAIDKSEIKRTIDIS